MSGSTTAAATTAQSRPEVGLEPRVRERPALREHAPSVRSEIEPLQRPSGHEAVVQRRIPRGEGLFERLAARDHRQDVLDRILQRIRMPRHDRLPPVHDALARFRISPIRHGSEMRNGCLLVDPDSESPRLRDTCQDHAATGGGHEHRVRPGDRDPPLPHPSQNAFAECDVDVVPADPRVAQPGDPRDAAGTRHRPRQSSSPLFVHPSTMPHAARRRT